MTAKDAERLFLKAFPEALRLEAEYWWLRVWRDKRGRCFWEQLYA